MTLDNIYLYRMTHIGNIPHILSHGIVHSTSPKANPDYIAIGDKSLIDCRKSKTVEVAGEKIVLGDYIPFYFGVRMPMLYVIQHGDCTAGHPRLCMPERGCQTAIDRHGYRRTDNTDCSASLLLI